ncbi:ABC-type transport auxiliary lipoprotein family protein [Halomonas sediminis]
MNKSSFLQRIPRPLLACITVLAVSGCTVLPEQESLTLYRLPASSIGEAPSSLGAVTLGVETPEAGRLLGSERIVVFPEPLVVSVYEGAHWHDDAPVLVQQRLIEALQESGLFASVSSGKLPTDYTLLSELRSFQSEYIQGHPEARLQLDVKLLDANRQPVASRSLSANARAESVEIPQVVAAFGEAGDELSRKLISWLHGELANQP